MMGEGPQGAIRSTIAPYKEQIELQKFFRIALFEKWTIEKP